MVVSSTLWQNDKRDETISPGRCPYSCLSILWPEKKEKLGIYVHHNLRLIISAYFNMGNCLCRGSFGTEMEEGQDD